MKKRGRCDRNSGFMSSRKNQGVQENHVAYALCAVRTHACPHPISKAPQSRISDHEHSVSAFGGAAASTVLKSGHGFDGTRRGKRRVLETLGAANVKGRVHNNSSAIYTDRIAVCVVALPNQKRLAHIGEPSRSRCLKVIPCWRLRGVRAERLVKLVLWEGGRLRLALLLASSIVSRGLEEVWEA